MKWGAVLFRIFITVAFLVFLVFFVSPEKAIEAFRGCDFQWVLVALLLMLVFIASRIYKWYLLVRQFKSNINVSKLIWGYLWGMALGMVTPGRVGEIYRVKASELPNRLIGLFVLEKFVEIFSLFILCIPAILAFELLPFWSTVLLVMVCIAIAVFWRSIALRAMSFKRLFPNNSKMQSLVSLQDVFGNLSLSGTFFFTLVCQMLFLFQAFLIIIGMGQHPDLSCASSFPVVLLGNLLPISVGGVGIREAIAIAVLKPQGLPEAVILNSFFLVSMLDLALPCIIGVFLHRIFLLPKDNRENEIVLLRQCK
jgi:uncharacterized membrane protein YbhN (UPF0104 family)